MKNEVTSKRVAKIAGKVLAQIKKSGFKGRNRCEAIICADLFISGDCAGRVAATSDTVLCTVADLKALAASALTQAPDRKKAK